MAASRPCACPRGSVPPCSACQLHVLYHVVQEEGTGKGPAQASVQGPRKRVDRAGVSTVRPHIETFPWSFLSLSGAALPGALQVCGAPTPALTPTFPGALS